MHSGKWLRKCRPASCPSGRTRRTSLGAAYPRQGQAQEVTGRPTLKRSALRSTQGNHGPHPCRPLSRNAFPRRNRPPRSPQPPTEKPFKKGSPVTTPCREAFSSFQPVTPHRVSHPVAPPFTSLLQIQNKTPAARKRQALSSPRRRGHSPCGLCRRGMSEGREDAASRLGTGRRDLGLEGPDHRDDEHAQHEADELKRPARLHVIKEGVAAGS